MDEYLTTTLTKLNTNNYNALHLVLGNESCDLDSAVCAIVYATFLNWQYNQIKCKVCTRAVTSNIQIKDDIYVPILNVDRKDYALKTEVVFFLKEKGILESHLVFRDDYDLSELVNKSKTTIVLVDHHVLAKRDQFLASFVTEVIDHRPMDKNGWRYADDTRCTMEIVGSCSTLVAQRIRDVAALLAKDVEFFTTYPVCSEMLRAIIILDTVNFSKEVKKATPHDEEIILFLESLLKPADYKTDRQRVLDSLISARSDVSSLSAAQLLRKDVKIIRDILIPSFPILVKEFLQRPGALQAVSEALIQNNCEVALLLGMDLSQGVQRDTALFSPKNPERAVKLSRHLEELTTPSLGLTPEKVAEASDCSYYLQLNLSASRKQYVAALNV